MKKRSGDLEAYYDEGFWMVFMWSNGKRIASATLEEVLDERKLDDIHLSDNQLNWLSAIMEETHV